MLRKTTDSTIAWVKLNRIKITFLFFCIVVACVFTLNARLLSLSYGLIDPSFNYAVSIAGAQKMAFGTDFIATYGPLGYIVANYLPDKLVFANLWLFFHVLLMAVGVFTFTYQYIKNSKFRWFASFTILYALSICSRGGFIEWGYLCVFLLYCFIYLRASTKIRPYIVGLLSFLVVIFVLTKFTLGFGSLVTLLLVILFAPNNTRRRKGALLVTASVICIAGFLLLGRSLGINSPVDYIHTAIIISGNFSSAMAFHDAQTTTATVLLFISIVSLVAWITLNERKDVAKYLFLLPSLLLVWKYCVTRQDGHILAALLVLIPIAVIYYFSLRKVKQRDIFTLIFVIFTCFMAMWANKIPFYGDNGFASIVISPIKRIVDGDFVKFIDMNQRKEDWAHNSAGQLEGAALPEQMRNEIGKSSVDIFPWETVIIAANDLEWQNRPSPFSFETYDPYLDNLNARFYQSEKAPEYVVWHNTDITGSRGIDNRHIVWDEPATFRALLENYELNKKNKDLMLLKRRKKPVQLEYKEVTLLSDAVNDSKWTKVPNQDTTLLTFVKFEVEEGINNKLQKLLIRGDSYYMQLKLESGKIYKYRFIKENTTQGYLIEGIPTNWNELASLIKDHSTTSKDKVVEYRVIYK